MTALGARMSRSGATEALSGLLAGPPAAVIRAAQLVWERPSLLAAATLWLLCVPVASTGEPDGVEIHPVDVGALSLVALVALRRLVKGGSASLSPLVVSGAAAVLAANAIATLGATDLGTGVVGFIRYAEIFVIIPLAVAMSLERRSDAVIVLSTVVGVGVVQGAIGVYQFVTGTGAAIGDDAVRAVGTFGAYDIMSMATVVSFAWLVALAAGLGARGRLQRAGLWGVGLLLVPLAMSLARGAWIAAVATALVAAAFAGWRRTVVTASVVGLVALGALGATRADLGVVSERVSSVVASASSPDRSVRDRYDMWRAAVGMWHDHPLTGVGPKNFALWRDTYAPLSLSSGSDISASPSDFTRVELLSPHNLYLLVGTEQGWIGIAAFGWLLLALLAGSLSRVRAAAEGTFVRVVGLFAIAFVCRYLVDSIWGDIGGPTSVASGVLMGVVFWYASGLPAEGHAASAGSLARTPRPATK